MGTRGAFGFYKDGVDKSTYNHYDSYPDGLGEEVVKFIRASNIVEMNEIFDRLTIVDSDATPTPEQIEACKQYADTSVSTGQLTEWYVLLRSAQGDLFALRDGLSYMIGGGKEFMKDSLFCEWAYIINLDDNVLEVYQGFQKTPDNNRYQISEPDNGYYHVKLLKTYPLENIPENWVEEIEALEEDE